MLLATLIAVMVGSGGCKGPSYSTCCSPEIIDDASYRNPPYDTLWRWFPKVSRPELTGELKVPDAYLFTLDTDSIAASLRKQLKDEARATATSFFSSLGMSCTSAGFDIQCEGILPLIYACVHKEPQPSDYRVRRERSLRLVILVSTSGYAVRNANLAATEPFKPWC